MIPFRGAVHNIHVGRSHAPEGGSGLRKCDKGGWVKVLCHIFLIYRKLLCMCSADVTYAIILYAAQYFTSIDQFSILLFLFISVISQKFGIIIINRKLAFRGTNKLLYTDLKFKLGLQARTNCQFLVRKRDVFLGRSPTFVTVCEKGRGKDG